MEDRVSDRISAAMNKAGFTAAAENFYERVRFYSERELARIERFWVS